MEESVATSLQGDSATSKIGSSLSNSFCNYTDVFGSVKGLKEMKILEALGAIKAMKESKTNALPAAADLPRTTSFLFFETSVRIYKVDLTLITCLFFNLACWKRNGWSTNYNESNKQRFLFFCLL